MEDPASGERRRPGRPVAIGLRVSSARLSSRCSTLASKGKRFWAEKLSSGIVVYSRGIRLFYYRLNNLFCRNSFGQAVEVEDEAVAQGWIGNLFDVFQGDIEAAFEQGANLGGHN